MTPHNLKIWALINIQLVLVDAYKAENESRADKGLAQAYGEETFLKIADKIAELGERFE